MNIKLNPHIALLCCNGIWGISYPIYTYALPKHIGVEAMVTITLVATGIMSLCTLLFKQWRGGKRVERKDMPLLVMAGMLVVLIRKYFLMAGLSMTSPIDGSVIAALGPIAVLLLSVAMSQDRFTKRKIIGVALGLTGVVVMLLSNSGHQSASDLLLGNILIMLCVICTAIYIVWFKDIVAKYPPMTILRWIMTSAAVIILPIGASSVTKVDYSGFDLNMWLLLAYMTFMPTLLPNYLLMYSLKRVKPALSSVYMYVQPVVATIISVLFGLGTLGWTKAFAGMVVFLGVLLVVSSYNNKSHMVTHKIEG